MKNRYYIKIENNSKGMRGMIQDNKFSSVYITIRLSAESNKIISIAAERSGRNKIQEARLRLEDHLSRFRSIAEPNHAFPLPREDTI